MNRPGFRTALLGVAILFASASRATAEQKLPEWIPGPSDRAEFRGTNAGSEVWLDSREVSVDAQGAIHTRARFVVRVADARDAAEARCEAYYVKGQGRVSAMRGWLVRDGVTVRTFGPDSIPDAVLSPEAVFDDEPRVKILDVSGFVRAGDVFACEWTLDDRPPFLQMEFDLTGRLPVRRAVVHLEVPPDWSFRQFRFGPDSIREDSEGHRTTWEVHDAAGMVGEASAPSPSQLQTRLALSLTPPASTRPRDFASWDSVGSWIRAQVPASEHDDELLARARSITVTDTTGIERWRPVARLVQDLRYASIQMGLGRGGGYRPHPADRVLRVGYGDCKDKANAFVELVRARGGRAWLVPTFLGDRDFVRPEWPTPRQFNHCIAAIAVDEHCPAPAVLHDPRYGALLFVDVTDPDTPLGELPELEQGGAALLVRDGASELIRLPEAPRDRWDVRYEFDLELRANGSAQGDWHAVLTGDAASRVRAARRALRGDSDDEWIRKLLFPGESGTRFSDLRFRDAHDAGLLLDGHLDVAHAVSDLGDGRRAMRLRWAPARVDLLPSVSARRLPIALERSSVHERAVIRLPAGWRVEDAPADEHDATDFADYATRSAHDASSITLERSVSFRRCTLPADRQPDVRRLQARVQVAERAKLVIAPSP